MDSSYQDQTLPIKYLENLIGESIIIHYFQVDYYQVGYFHVD